MGSSTQRDSELLIVNVFAVKVSTCSSHGIRHTTESGPTLNKGFAAPAQYEHHMCSVVTERHPLSGFVRTALGFVAERGEAERVRAALHYLGGLP